MTGSIASCQNLSQPRSIVVMSANQRSLKKVNHATAWFNAYLADRNYIAIDFVGTFPKEPVPQSNTDKGENLEAPVHPAGQSASHSNPDGVQFLPLLWTATTRVMISNAIDVLFQSKVQPKKRRIWWTCVGTILTCIS